jgi:hypothetical protein
VAFILILLFTLVVIVPVFNVVVGLFVACWEGESEADRIAKMPTDTMEQLKAYQAARRAHECRLHQELSQ